MATALEGEPGVVRISGITGDGGRLPLDAAKNCVGIAAAETLRLLEDALGPLSAGVSLHLDKACPSPASYRPPARISWPRCVARRAVTQGAPHKAQGLAARKYVYAERANM